MLKIIYILASFCVIYAELKEPPFRYDYKYFKEARGWLKLHTIPMNWNNARFQCNIEGAMLVSPLNKPLVSAISKLLQSYTPSPRYTFSGVNSLFAEGVYTSIEGVPLGRLEINWSLNEPVYAAPGCLVFSYNATMGNRNCKEHLPFICYKKYTRLVINECGTIDNGYRLKNGTKNCFKYHSENVEWDKAFVICHAEGAHLTTTIDSIDWLIGTPKKERNPNKKEKRRSASIGYKYIDTTWWDVKGNVMNVQPYPFDKQTCGGLSEGEFTTLYCDNTMPFICEKSVDSLKPNKRFPKQRHNAHKVTSTEHYSDTDSDT